MNVFKIVYIYTKVNYLDSLVEFVVCTEIFFCSFSAMILNIRKASGPKYVIVTATNWPIEMGHTPLIVHNISILDEV